MKLYADMTKKQQLEYRTDVVANWIKDGVTFALVLLSRKVRPSNGEWYWTSEWCWKDCEDGLKPIDKHRLYEKLGITEKPTDPYLASNLRSAGYNIIDLDHVIVFNAKK